MNVWDRIEKWLEKHAPQIREDLRIPAEEKAIEDAELAMAVELPNEFLDVYTVHNGQDRACLDGDWKVIAIESVVVEWKIQKKLLDRGDFADTFALARGPVRPVWWSDKWIPFAYNGSGDLQCIDLDPPANGNLGQVIVYWHGRPERERIADSITAWFERLAVDLEAGKYSVEGIWHIKRRR